MLIGACVVQQKEPAVVLLDAADGNVLRRVVTVTALPERHDPILIVELTAADLLARLTVVGFLSSRRDLRDLTVVVIIISFRHSRCVAGGC